MWFRTDFAAATRLPDGRVLMVGGFDDVGAAARALIYDPAADEWIAAPDMHIARFDPAITLLRDGGVFVYGGWQRDPGTALKTAEIYDPAANQWTLISSTSVSYAGPTATLLPAVASSWWAIRGVRSMIRPLPNGSRPHRWSMGRVSRRRSRGSLTDASSSRGVIAEAAAHRPNCSRNSRLLTQSPLEDARRWRSYSCDVGRAFREVE